MDPDILSHNGTFLGTLEEFSADFGHTCDTTCWRLYESADDCGHWDFDVVPRCIDDGLPEWRRMTLKYYQRDKIAIGDQVWRIPRIFQVSSQRLAINSGHSHGQCRICDEEILQRVDAARRIANTRLRQIEVPNLVAEIGSASLRSTKGGTNTTFVSGDFPPRTGTLPRWHALHNTCPTIERCVALLFQDTFRSRWIGGESIHRHRGHL